MSDTAVTVPKPQSITERVTKLEQAFSQLHRADESLKRSQRETRKRIRHLEEIVQEMPARIAEKIEAEISKQTDEFRVLLAQNETANADRIGDLARQWPTGSIILATLLGGGLVGLIVDLILAATGHPHIR